VLTNLPQEVLEGLVRVGFLLEKVDPGVTGEVIAYNQAVATTADGRDGLFTAEVNKNSFEFLRSSGSSGRLSPSSIPSTVGAPRSAKPQLSGRVMQKGFVQVTIRTVENVNVMRSTMRKTGGNDCIGFRG